MNMLGEVTHSSCGFHLGMYLVSVCSSQLIQRPHIVNKPQKSLQTGVLVQAVLNTPNSFSGATVDAGLKSQLSVNIGPLLL